MLKNVLYAFALVAIHGSTSRILPRSFNGRQLNRIERTVSTTGVDKYVMSEPSSGARQMNRVASSISHDASESGSVVHSHTPSPNELDAPLPDQTHTANLSGPIQSALSVAELRVKMEEWDPMCFFPNELKRTLESEGDRREEHIQTAIRFITLQLEDIEGLSDMRKALTVFRKSLLPEIYCSNAEDQSWSIILKSVGEYLNERDTVKAFLGASRKKIYQQVKSTRDPPSPESERELGGRKRLSVIGKIAIEPLKKQKLEREAKRMKSSVPETEGNQAYMVHGAKTGAIVVHKEKTETSIEEYLARIPDEYDFGNAVIADGQLLKLIKTGVESTSNGQELYDNIASSVKEIYLTSYITGNPNLKWIKEGEVSSGSKAILDHDTQRLVEAREDAQARLKEVFSYFEQDMILFKSAFDRLMDEMINALDNCEVGHPVQLMKKIPSDVEKIISEVAREAKVKEPLYRELENFKHSGVEKIKELVAEKKGYTEADFTKVLDVLLEAIRLEINTEGKADIAKSLDLVTAGLYQVDTTLAGHIRKMADAILQDKKVKNSWFMATVQSVMKNLTKRLTISSLLFA